MKNTKIKSIRFLTKEKSAAVQPKPAGANRHLTGSTMMKTYGYPEAILPIKVSTPLLPSCTALSRGLKSNRYILGGKSNSRWGISFTSLLLRNICFSLKPKKMRLRIGTFVIFSLLGQCPSFSQAHYPNRLFVELGGHAYYYSLNYERGFSNGLVAKVGASVLGDMWVVPMTFGKVFGVDNHHLEADGGLGLVNYEWVKEEDSGRETMLMATVFIGYRYQKPEGQFFFRAGLTPLYRIYGTEPGDEGNQMITWAGIGVGYAF
jgi:hypothetical protein